MFLIKEAVYVPIAEDCLNISIESKKTMQGKREPRVRCDCNKEMDIPKPAKNDVVRQDISPTPVNYVFDAITW